MRDLWWKLVDLVVVGVCLVLMLSDWLERHETRKVMLRLSPDERDRLLDLAEGRAHG